MKRFFLWTAAAALAVFVIDWGIMGLKLLDGCYDITAEAYIGAVCIVILIVSIIARKLIGSKCPHCGKLLLVNGKYCHNCGGKL